EGCSVAEIASRTQSPVATVKTRLRRGIEILRIRLDAEFKNREAWCLALAPFAALTNTGSVAGGAAKTLLFTMSTKAVVSTAAAALLLAAGVLFLLQTDPPRDIAIIGSLPASAPEAVDATKTITAETQPSGITNPARSATEMVAKAGNRLSHAKGRCINRDGKPIAGVSIFVAFRGNRGTSNELSPAPMRNERSIVTEKNGGFLWTELLTPEILEKMGMHPSLNREFVFLADGFATRSLQMQFVPGEIYQAGDIILEPGGNLAGDVLDSNGKPAENVIIRLVGDDGRSVDRPYAKLYGLYGTTITTGQSDANGKFIFEGAPAGAIRVVASTPETCYSISDRIILNPGERYDSIHLLLELLPPEATIEGIVLAPDGTPVAGQIEAQAGSGSAMFNVGPDGKFKHRLHVPGPIDYSVQNSKLQLGPATLKNVAAGSRNVILQLTASKIYQLDVVDHLGEPILEWARSVVPAGNGNRNFTWEKAAVPGKYTLIAPSVVFTIEVQTPGYAPLTSGPHDPNEPSSNIKLILQKLPAIEGRVVVNGKPVEGASVLLYAAKAWVRTMGFPARYARASAAFEKTDANGKFKLLPSDRIRFAFLRVEPPLTTDNKNALAPGEYGPFAFGEGNNTSDIEIVLTPGGSIEGRVFVPNGRDPAGRIVAVSNGDGHPVYTKTKADGSYQINRLMPGRYAVELFDESPEFGTSEVSDGDAEAVVETPWNCIVEPGKTTRYDIDYRNGLDPIFNANISLGNNTFAGAKIELTESDNRRKTQKKYTHQLSQDGNVRATLERGGHFQLITEWTSPDGVYYHISDYIDIKPHGETSYTYDRQVGTITGKLPDGLNLAVERVSFMTGGSAPYLSAIIPVAAGGTFKFDKTPAGNISILVYPANLRIKAKVVAGETTQIEFVK
ncbi:MAG: hypothetical protein ACKVS6_14900, partial [Planctomycetota bacterium]